MFGRKGGDLVAWKFAQQQGDIVGSNGLGVLRRRRTSSMVGKGNQIGSYTSFDPVPYQFRQGTGGSHGRTRRSHPRRGTSSSSSSTRTVSHVLGGMIFSQDSLQDGRLQCLVQVFFFILLFLLLLLLLLLLRIHSYLQTTTVVRVSSLVPNHRCRCQLPLLDGGKFPGRTDPDQAMT